MHHAWSESTVELQQFYLQRGGIVRVELAERGAYVKGTVRACKLATKSARRPRELDEFEARDELSSYKMRLSGGGGVKGPCKAGANEAAGGGGGPRRGRSGVRGGNHGVRWRRERRHWRGGHGGVSGVRRDRGEVSGEGHGTRRRWGWCYRRRADKRGYSIRGDRCGVTGGAHRTRGRCYRRGT